MTIVFSKPAKLAGSANVGPPTACWFKFLWVVQRVVRCWFYRKTTKISLNIYFYNIILISLNAHTQMHPKFHLIMRCYSIFIISTLVYYLTVNFSIHIVHLQLIVFHAYLVYAPWNNNDFFISMVHYIVYKIFVRYLVYHTINSIVHQHNSMTLIYI